MTNAQARIARWELAQAEPSVVRALARASGLSEVTARILVSRGIADSRRAEEFLAPDLARDWRDPGLVPGMSAAAGRVADAVRAGRRIVVFGDFDLDGISAAAVAARGLAAMGANVSAVVPHRFREGYGLTAAAIERVASARPELVVTVDCGISAAAEVDLLAHRGIDVVVTDHHEPGSGVPQSVPVANPKLDPGCPSFALAGAGVALKLVEVVGRLLGHADVWRALVDLATLGTVADIVPLVGENRALVAEGVRMMRTSPRVGIASLTAIAGVSLETMSADMIAFTLAPRLNAAGRMGDPAEALELLMTDDPGVAERMAESLDAMNRERQAAEQELTQAAIAQAERVYSGRRSLVLAGDGWHEGVKGIVASRVSAAYGVPAFLFSIDGEEARGSGRSIGSIDIFDAVTRAAACCRITRFGGHAAAVGLALSVHDLPRFADALNDALDELPDEAFAGATTLDAEISLEEVSSELAAELERLAPYGHDNPRPLIASRGVFMNGRERVGRDGAHLRFVAYDGAASVPAIAFRCRDIETLALHDEPVDLAYTIESDEWRGRKRVQLIVREVAERYHTPEANAAALVEDLFAHADQIIAREEYAGIGDAASFNTKLAGVSFEDRQEVVERLGAGALLRVERQPANEFDPNAIALFDPTGSQVGFFNRRLAAVLGPVLDAGGEYDVEVTQVTGGEDGKAFGVNVLVSKRGLATDSEDEATVRAQHRARLAALPGEELDAELVRLFLGDRTLHAAQQQSLAHLAAGTNCLLVMATGRGKSVVFHLHAARVALREGGVSIFVYPLRALVADQAFHLSEAFVQAGLSVRTVTGESSQTARDDAFLALAAGELDVVLTTPEFLDHHAARFAESGKVRLVVVDEAHHVGAARAGHRPAYGRLDRALETLGRPGVLAVTATAGNETADAIGRVLGIETVVVDPTVRDNLLVEDRRDIADKDSYVAALATRGEKMVVYVNSREASVRIARMLRKRVPGVAMRTAFYNGGLTRETRHAVERAFRAGDVNVIVATSAFGEGVNIPDIRDVVLYHLPFGEVEFNQMSGRGGRDGATARVHLLFGGKDARINEVILGSLAPSRDDLAALYLVLKDAAVRSADALEVTNAELAERVARRRPGCSFDERGVSTAVGILKELGLIAGEGHGAYRRLTLLPAPDQKLDLNESVRYAEGLEEIAEFAEFKRWALSAEPAVLLAKFNRPILPTHS